MYLIFDLCSIPDKYSFIVVLAPVQHNQSSLRRVSDKQFYRFRILDSSVSTRSVFITRVEGHCFNSQFANMRLSLNISSTICATVFILVSCLPIDDAKNLRSLVVDFVIQNNGIRGLEVPAHHLDRLLRRMLGSGFPESSQFDLKNRDDVLEWLSHIQGYLPEEIPIDHTLRIVDFSTRALLLYVQRDRETALQILSESLASDESVARLVVEQFDQAIALRSAVQNSVNLRVLLVDAINPLKQAIAKMRLTPKCPSRAQDLSGSESTKAWLNQIVSSLTPSTYGHDAIRIVRDSAAALWYYLSGNRYQSNQIIQQSELRDFEPNSESLINRVRALRTVTELAIQYGTNEIIPIAIQMLTPILFEISPSYRIDNTSLEDPDAVMADLYDILIRDGPFSRLLAVTLPGLQKL